LLGRRLQSVCLAFATLHILVISSIEVHNRNLLLTGLVFVVVPFLPSSHMFLDVGFTIAERNLFMSRSIAD
jgi:hypothetical protein